MTTSLELSKVVSSYSYLFEEMSGKFLVPPYEHGKTVLLRQVLPSEKNKLEVKIKLEFTPVSRDELFSYPRLACDIISKVFLTDSDGTISIPSALCKVMPILFGEEFIRDTLNEEDLCNFNSIQKGDTTLTSISDLEISGNKDMAKKNIMMLEIVYGNSEQGNSKTAAGLFASFLVSEHLDSFTIHIEDTKK
mgnify:CR=1 FL=1